VFRFRSSFLGHPETLHYSVGVVAEIFGMIRRCAAIAETEGTWRGDARRYRLRVWGGPAQTID
jgi:hypothetical protein